MDDAMPISFLIQRALQWYIICFRILFGRCLKNFFKVFHEKMSEAQMEIKSSVTVNTSDIAAKANEEKDLSNKELDKALKKRNAKPANGVILTEHLKEELDDALTSTQQVKNSLSFSTKALKN